MSQVPVPQRRPKVPGRYRTRRATAVLLGFAAASVVVDAQTIPAPFGRSSLGIYGASASVVHFVNPNRNPYALSYSPLWSLGNDTLTTAQAEIGARWSRPDSTVVFSYVPTYTSSRLFPEGNRWNHSFDIRGVGDRGVRLSPRWRLEFGLNAAVSDLRHYFLTQTEYGRVAAVPMEPEELAAAFIDNQFTNSELASALTGAPFVETPATLVLFGNRMLSAVGGASLTYLYSPRLRIGFTTLGVRSQHLSSNASAAEGDSQGFIPHSTFGSGGVDVNYSLSPRSTIGVSASTGRTFSTLQKTQSTSTLFKYSRRMSPNWFLLLNGGAGRLTALQDYAADRRPEIFALGSITAGYGAGRHTLVGTVDRSLTEEIGVGGGAGFQTRAGWGWSPGAGTWSFSAEISRQEWQRDAGLPLKSWRAAVDVARALGAGFSWQARFSYMNYSGPQVNGPAAFGLGAFGTGVAWTPGRRLAR